MNRIKEVKERADIVRVAQYFNLILNKSNKCLCPFHKEKTPSFSISSTKQIWKCFGCNKGGDVISLVSELLNINAYESAKHINNILNLGIDFGKNFSKLEIEKHKSKLELVEHYKKWENETFQLLCDYFHLLQKWEELNDPENELYIEALQNKDKIDYYIDIFIYGTDEDKIWFWKKNINIINKIKLKLSILGKEKNNV